MITRLDHTRPAFDVPNLFTTCALMLATGASLPRNLREWPAGLAATWNDFADGAPEGCATIGDAARAFLQWRVAELIRIRDAIPTPEEVAKAEGEADGV